MKVSDILSHVDLGFIALPVFQRGYVWNRDQVRQLFSSMYRSYPVGGLLLWGTQSSSVDVRGDVVPAVSPVRMLLDGQQRVTSLYGVIRGTPPPFFDGNPRAFEELHFHLEEESFEFYQPVRMQNDQRWVDVSKVMQAGEDEIAQFAAPAASDDTSKLMCYMTRLGKLRGIRERELQEEEISGEDKTIDVIVDIFNRVNSGGTKLSTGDLALARICADWPEARDEMQAHLARWAKDGFDKFDLDWLLRSVNTVLTGRARFAFLSDKGRDEIRDGLKRAVVALDVLLNLVCDRLGLDHGTVLFSRNAFPVMARFIDQRGGHLTDAEQSKLMYWYVAGAIRGRFSGATESTMEQDLATLEPPSGGLDRLIEQLELWSGSVEIHPSHFDAATSNSRFYPVLYLLTRVGQSRDFCSGLELKQHLVGKQSRLQVHHIFPKSRLRDRYHHRQVNALANFCFLTAECNGPKHIGNRLPEEYFPEYESSHPGVLASQWIPMDTDQWTIQRYPQFLERRRELLAAAANELLQNLRDGVPAAEHLESSHAPEFLDEEDRELAALDEWVKQLGLSRGEFRYELPADPSSGDPIALDLAWPEGLQAELTEPVALLLNEPAEVVAAASTAGFRCFTDANSFRQYVMALLGE